MALSSMVAVRISEDQLREARLVAILEKMTMSELIREALRDRTEQVVATGKGSR